jgi:hypothetical protein
VHHVRREDSKTIASPSVSIQLDRPARIPLAIKILHTLFLCILVPAYWWEYGPANFLWFSDIALFVTLFALWLENRLLASTQALSVAFLESLWIVDFVVHLATGKEIIGLSSYMFDGKIPLFIRGLSLFHVWLPFLLGWLVWRLGYDRRAWLVQSGIAWSVLLICFFLTTPQENINWVFGPGNKPQHQIAPSLYLILVMLCFPLAVYFPSHILLRKLVGARS